jgi:hypothetical protein
MLLQIRDRCNPIEPPAISSDGNDSYPAMAAGITDHIWTIGEIMMMLVIPDKNNA